MIRLLKSFQIKPGDEFRTGTPYIISRTPITVKIYFGEELHFPFIFDTGSQITLFPIKLADRHGIKFSRAYPDKIGLKGRRYTGFLDKLDCTIAGKKLALTTLFYELAGSPTSSPEEMNRASRGLPETFAEPVSLQAWAERQFAQSPTSASVESQMEKQASKMMLDNDERDELAKLPLVLGRTDLFDHFAILATKKRVYVYDAVNQS
jgi:hypothetical protein